MYASGRGRHHPAVQNTVLGKGGPFACDCHLLAVQSVVQQTRQTRQKHFLVTGNIRVVFAYIYSGSPGPLEMCLLL
jgi:hypothetical protein